MAASTITSKGQVTIPKSVRERLGLHSGDRLVFAFDEDGGLRIRAARVDELDAVFGVLHRLARARPATVREMRDALRRRAASKLRATRP